MMHMPCDFKVGETQDCWINGKPARLTWRDANHLVIEPDDVGPIVAISKAGDLIAFTCGDAGTTSKDYDVDADEKFGGAFIVSEKSETDR
jgi:hypothetical protein